MYTVKERIESLTKLINEKKTRLDALAKLVNREIELLEEEKHTLEELEETSVRT